MEMGLIVATFVMSALSALCSVAALTILLVTAPKEEETPSVTATQNHGEWSEATFLRGGKKSRDTHDLRATPDVEKRRRQAVNAKQHQNFMDYDGSPQTPIDPNTILADGG